MNKVVKYILLSGAAIVLTVLVLTGAILYSSQALEFALTKGIQFANEHTNIKIKLNSVSGSLISGLRAQGLTVDFSLGQIHVKSLVCEYSYNFWKNRLIIDQLKLDQPDITLSLEKKSQDSSGASEQKKGFTLESLPMEIDLRQVAIGNLTLAFRQGENSISLANSELTGSANIARNNVSWAYKLKINGAEKWTSNLQIVTSDFSLESNWSGSILIPMGAPPSLKTDAGQLPLTLVLKHFSLQKQNSELSIPELKIVVNTDYKKDRTKFSGKLQAASVANEKISLGADVDFAIAIQNERPTENIDAEIAADISNFTFKPSPTKIKKITARGKFLALSKDEIDLSINSELAGIESAKVKLDTASIGLQGRASRDSPSFRFKGTLNSAGTNLVFNPLISSRVSLGPFRFRADPVSADSFGLSLGSFNFELAEGAVTFEGSLRSEKATESLQMNLDSILDFGKSQSFWRQVMSSFGVGGRLLSHLEAKIKKSGNTSEVRLQGNLQPQGLKIVSDKISVLNISGKIPFAEDLALDTKKLRFSQEIQPSPFSSVEFDQVRSLTAAAPSIEIQEIKWLEKSYGPFVGYVSLRQNLFSVNQFDFNFDTGKIYGEFFVDGRLKNLQLGFLGRVTGLDLNQSLPKKYSVSDLSTPEALNLRSGTVFDLRKGLLDGRIDVQRIGKTQLSSMINLLDPDYNNEQMNKMRKYLKLGHPSSLVANFKHGYADIDVIFSVLGLEQEVVVNSVPIGALITQRSAPILKKIDGILSSGGKSE